MSVLSKIWNRIWSTHLVIALDQQFYEMINQSTFSNGYKDIVYQILLQHMSGPIIQFFLNISSTDLNNWDIDHWLLRVSTRGVHKLTIKNYSEDPYILPSFLFDSSSKLRYLSITNCTFKLPRDTSPFKKLVIMSLCLSSSFFKFVVPDSLPKMLGAPLVHRQILMLAFTFHALAQVSAVICLLQSAPQLHTLNIQLLLARCPSLVKVTVTPTRLLEDDEVRRFFLDLL
ncbi:hypothetical protein HAX54_036635 [Datura stramonium]|uniref:Uncharacterized protein n=1 Tax=Datura stramonium TaxID=4076 RepID=A0ABS8SGN5_DATST|nr:hypothetical protein [Datura stramonium]